MKNKTIITITLATLLACTAFTGCEKKDSATETEPNVKETESTGTSETKTTEKEVEDQTYCNLMSDPNFDTDNGIRDNYMSDIIKSDDLRSKHGTEVLYNYVDGDKYAEITGATATEVNKTVKIQKSGICFYPHLAYYGVEPSPGVVNAISMFALIDTSLQDTGDVDRRIPSGVEMKVLKSYTIPEDKNSGRLVIGSAETHADYEDLLCEVEYNGTVGYAILQSTWLVD